MVHLKDLPPEVLHQICREIYAEGPSESRNNPFRLLNIAVTCRQFRDVTFEIYWEWARRQYRFAIAKYPAQGWGRITYDTWKHYDKHTGCCGVECCIGGKIRELVVGEENRRVTWLDRVVINAQVPYVNRVMKSWEARWMTRKLEGTTARSQCGYDSGV